MSDHSNEKKPAAVTAPAANPAASNKTATAAASASAPSHAFPAAQHPQLSLPPQTRRVSRRPVSATAAKKDVVADITTRSPFPFQNDDDRSNDDSEIVSSEDDDDDDDDDSTVSSSSVSSSSTEDSSGNTSNDANKDDHTRSIQSGNDDDDDVEDDNNAAEEKYSEMIRAASQSTPYQMQRRQPILLGRNRIDNSLNVQLPNSTMIVVDAEQFPEYLREETGQRTNKATKKASATAAAAAARLPHSVAEFSQAIPPNASAVVHVFDRRVNLDTTVTDVVGHDKSHMYSLLRGWAQDDPYRYIPPPDDYTDALLQSKPAASLKKESDIDAPQQEQDQQLYSKPNSMDVLSSLRSDTNQAEDNNNKEHATDALRKEFLTQMRQSRQKRPKRRSRTKQFRQAVQSMERRGIYLKTSKLDT